MRDTLVLNSASLCFGSPWRDYLKRLSLRRPNPRRLSISWREATNGRTLVARVQPSNMPAQTRHCSTGRRIHWLFFKRPGALHRRAHESPPPHARSKMADAPMRHARRREQAETLLSASPRLPRTLILPALEPRTHGLYATLTGQDSDYSEQRYALTPATRGHTVWQPPRRAAFGADQG